MAEVHWTQNAINDLANLWGLNPTIRDDITRACDQMEQDLGFNPLLGVLSPTPNLAFRRAYSCSPLEFEYIVNDQTNPEKVFILTVLPGIPPITNGVHIRMQ